MSREVETVQVAPRVVEDLVAFYRWNRDPRIINHRRPRDFPKNLKWARSLREYVERTRVLMRAPFSFVMAAGIYMFRVQRSGIPPAELTLRELFAGCFLLAFKYHEEEDDVYCISRMSRACGISRPRLEDIESLLWEAMDYRLSVRLRDIEVFCGIVSGGVMPTIPREPERRAALVGVPVPLLEACEPAVSSFL